MEEALETVERAEPMAGSMLGLFHHPFFETYATLSRLAVAGLDVQRRPQLMEKVEESLGRMRRWADHCPQNFLHRYHLMLGEKARVEGDYAGAMTAFREAIQGAEQQGYLHERALGYELMGRCCLAWDQPAEEPLRQARQLYKEWEARAKVEQLEGRYRDQLPDLESTLSSSTTTSQVELDISTLLKSHRAISSEVNRVELLKTSLSILLENAGAVWGALIQPGPTVAVWGRSDEALKVSGPAPQLAWSLVNLVLRTGSTVVIDDAREDARFDQDPYLQSGRARSILCLPVEQHGQLTACLYAENDLTPGAFTRGRLELLKMLLSQVAISLENASLYGQLESLVEERTQELEAALARIESVNKARGLFLASMSHEIRNPLNAIINLGELCLGCRLPDDARDYLNKLRSSSDVLLELVNDILDLSRIDADRLELEEVGFSVKEVIERLTDIHGQAARKKGLILEAVVDQGVPRRLMGDPTRVGQVLSNLLGNAVKFTEKGRIDLTVTPGRSGPRFVVRDTGIGIAPEHVDRVLEPFSQAESSTTRKFGGSGLGLAICNRLVSLMGGRLELRSGAG